jgi:FkbM family methyltransferase
MLKFDKWFLPDGETHLCEWMTTVGHRRDGRLMYQGGKYQACLEHVTRRGFAIDIGAHAGLWSYFMAQDFERLVGFEPMREHAQCWHQNLAGLQNAELIECALGREEIFVSLECRTKVSSGDTQVSGQGKIPMKTLDSFGFQDVDFIKIDCEGYELNVLEGAVETIVQSKPCIIVEQKGDMSLKYGARKMGAVKFLEALGAKVVVETSGDYILKFHG